jgi:signal transduction histidine kinase
MPFTTKTRMTNTTICLIVVVLLAAILMVTHGHNGSGTEPGALDLPIGWLYNSGQTLSHRIVGIVLCGLILCFAVFGIAFAERSGPPRRVTRNALVKDHGMLQARLRRSNENYLKARVTILALQEQLLAAQEEERRAISRELHDSTLGHLAAAGLMLMRLNAAAPMSSEAKSVLDQAKSSLKLAAKELRAFTYLMHPPVLESTGLRATVEQFVAGFSQRTGVKVRVRCQGALDGLPFDVQRCAFRILQEALSNVHRHAKATEVRIYLASTSASFALMVSDNGQGFPQNASAAPARLGVGIPGMRIRLQRMGGSLRIMRIGVGTSVRAHIPLDRVDPRLPMPNGRHQRAA